MALKKSIKFTQCHTFVHCAPTRAHCSKGEKSSASMSTLDACEIGNGLKKKVQVYDQVEGKMYTFDAKEVLKRLYQCGSSDFMAFMYKKTPALEVK